ncbi:MAG TPA: LysR family transcriptional regulator [Pseudorhizobium sp.]|nr:LysR family transcriptional regulator [Pseudorhizobium sp.]
MSRITIAQLEAFFWTATLRSVDQAARRLNLSQPTISLRLKSLETELGSSLFDRIGRGVRLSSHGLALLEDAREVLDGVEKITSQKNGKRVGGRIRVGFSEGFAIICLSPILARLHRLYPDLSPELMVSTTPFIEPDLHARELDLAFIVNPTEHEDFRLVPLGAQPTSWVASTRWDLPAVVTPRDLMIHPIISNPIGSINYRQVRGWFASAGLSPKRLDICNSVALLAHLVNTGVAIGVYPSKMAEREIEAGTVRLLKTIPPIPDTPVFAKFPSSAESANVRACINTVREVLAELNYLTAMGL